MKDDGRIGANYAANYDIGNRSLLQQRAADIVMVDPTWSGGITESHKIAILADTYGLPVSMHDGSKILLRKLDPDYDPTDRARAAAYVQERAMRNECVTGLIYVDQKRRDFHARHNTPEAALNSVPFERLCPGAAALPKILASFR